MEMLMLAVLAVILVAGGIGVTIVMAQRMPMAVLERAQQHGRFANLGSQQASGGSRKSSGSGNAAGLRPLQTA